MRQILVLTLLAAAGLAGCTETDTYPITGEQCGPDDPVKGLDAGDCTPPVASVGTF